MHQRVRKSSRNSLKAFAENKYIGIFSTSARAQVEPMVIEIDRTKWEVPRNRFPPRHHSAEKQVAICTQINK